MNGYADDLATVIEALDLNSGRAAGSPLGLGFWPFFGANCVSRFFCSLSG